jgi:PKD repeat protein
VANFIPTDSVSCSGLVQFTDQSTNAPNSWRWSFGDGQFSVLQNPQHQYSPGANTYTVKLKVVNPYGTDSVTRVSVVRVTGDPVPVAPTCRPASATPGFGMGIDSVRLAGGGQVLVNSSPNESDGYRDYTCGLQGEVYRGRTATLRLRTIQPMGTRVVGWIDYDNNGDFQPVSERILNSNAPVNGVYVVTFTVPTTALLDTPLRMRLGSDWGNNPAMRPCGNQTGMTIQPQYGQFEDYTVFVRDPVAVGADRAPLALTVAPNPTADGRVTIRLSGDDAGSNAGSTLTLTVRSVLGQVVARHTLTVRSGAETSLDLSALPRGVYSVQTDSATPALRGTVRLLRD